MRPCQHRRMPEVVKFVHHGSSRITPKIIEKLLHQLALLKAEFTQLNAPKFPHLVDQLEFLADVVEDFAEGVLKEMPYAAASAAAFAVIYAHRQVDLIPNFIGQRNHADDSAVVRAVLIEYEHDLSKYALDRKLDWEKIGVKP